MSAEDEAPRPERAEGAQTTTPARSWAELNESVQDGFAVLDTSSRLAFVSDRFLSVLGPPEEFVGLPARDILPALSDDDPRGLKPTLDAGEQVDFEQHVVSAEGTSHWFRMTAVPSTALGNNLSAVVFARDISSEARRFIQLRETTAELTRVENERHRRISREVHDGPVQLLAALVFRLGMNNEPGSGDLQRAASEVSNALRSVIDEFSPAIERIKGAHIKQWIDPMVAGTGLDVVIEDHRTSPSGLAEAQAAFVMLYQAVRAVRDATTPRTLTLRLDDENGGERIVLTMPSRPPEAVEGERAARLRAIIGHAQALGGTLSHSLDKDDVRVFSMWIPKLTPSGHRADHVRPPSHPAAPRPTNDLTSLPPLSDAGWLEVVDAAPERMAELNADLSLSFVNARMARGLGLTSSDLIDTLSTDLLRSGSVDEMDETINQLKNGRFSETRWRSSDGPGGDRVVHLAFSPRLTSDGDFAGTFVTTNDHSDIEVLDELYERALADLTNARHLAIETTVGRLTKPLRDCERLIERLDGYELTSSEPAPVRAIRRGLLSALQSIKSSSSVFTPPPQSTSEFDGVLRDSLGTILDGRQIVVVDATNSPPPAETFEVMFRIAREAVNNAVLHGRARTIIIEVADGNDGRTCTVHDDGIGLGPGQLQHQPGHLGTRSMQARARERGGTCTIEAHPTVGTVVSLWLPTDPNRRSYADGFDPAR